MAKIPIHIKIRKKSNPFDKADEPYFEKRWTNSWKKEATKKKKTLWLLQEGKCSRCKGKLEFEDELHVHHIVMKCLGGNDTLSNLELMHGVCHRQLHATESA